MTLNKNIKKYRKEAGLTQKVLASQSGLSFSLVSKLESGEQSNPSFETLKKIADVLKISPAELVNDPLTIEEQIDEYIEYKKGLNQTTPKEESTESMKIHKKKEFQVEPCIDLNFMKKIQAINTIPEPKDDLEHECLTYLQRPEMKRLFYSLKNASKDEIERVITIIETLQGN